MQLPLIQIDAFAEALFEGNPAAVMPLHGWLDDAMLQQLASENNLSETAFYVEQLPAEVALPTEPTPVYHLRWFTPAMEVDLCGHATLATAAHLFEDVHPEAPRLSFWTRSRWLSVERTGTGRLVLDFPAEKLVAVAVDPIVVAALGVGVQEAYRATDLIYVTDSVEAIKTMTPNFGVLAALDVRGVVVTAAADAPGIDFVSRWFGARSGVAEDPVTGSAHSQIAPYWAHRLGRNALTARQLSARGGTVGCLVTDNRVRLTGGYRRYLDGVVTISQE